MKKTFTLLLTLGLVLSLCACGSKEESKGVVNVYNWGEYIDESIFDTFQEQTGIEVKYSIYDSNETMYTKLAGGGVSYDIVIPSDYMISRMIQEEMLLELDFEQIPNFANIDPTYTNMAYDAENAYSVPYMWGTTGIIYNSTMQETPITSWADLFDKEITGTGNLLMFDNSRDAVGVALLALGYDLNTTSEAEIKEAVDLLVAQKEAGIVQSYVMDQIFDKMINNEAAIGMYYAGDYLTMLEDNADLVWVQPTDGANYFVDAMCVPTCCENYDNAMAFINFMCSDEAALANCYEVGYSTPSATAYPQLDAEVRENPISYPTADYIASCGVFANLPADTLALYSSEWTRLGLAEVG